MGTVYWLITGLILLGSQSNARPVYGDADFSNARFLEALLYEKTETLKAAISLLSQLNLPLLCQSVAADPHAKFATVADLLHFATVVVQSQENMTSSLDDLQEYSTLPTEIPFDKITSVYPKAVTETVSLDNDQAIRPVFPNPEMLENDFKPIEDLDRKDGINGKLLEKQQLVINSHDSINGENDFESESRLLKNKSKLPQEKQTSERNTKSSIQKKPSQSQTQRTTGKIQTTKTIKTERFPQTTGASTYVTLESENSFTDLPDTQRPRRPDESYYGRSDQKPSQPTSSHSRPAFTTPLHWLIREKWPQIEKSSQELLKGGKLTSEELSREILPHVESDNRTITNQTVDNSTISSNDTTNTTSTPTTTKLQKQSTFNSTVTKMTTVTKRTQPTADSRTVRITSSKVQRNNNNKTTTNRNNKTNNKTISVTVTASPGTTSRSTVTRRKSPYLTTKSANKTSRQAPKTPTTSSQATKTSKPFTQAPKKSKLSSQAPKTSTTSTPKVTHGTTNATETIKSNETKQNEGNSKSSSHSKSVKPVFTTINITQILELTKTASPTQSRTHVSTKNKTSVPSTKITLNGLTTTVKPNTVTINQTVFNDINTTVIPRNKTSSTTALPIKPQSHTTETIHNITAKTTISNKHSKPDNNTLSTTSQTRNITKMTTKHLPQNHSTTVSKSPLTTTTVAISVVNSTAAKSTTQKSTTKAAPVRKQDNSLENSVTETESQKPTLREKIVPVQNSRDSDRSDLGDYGNEITQEETNNIVAPGQNDDDSFGFFTCPTIFGFYSDAINCGQFYICSWSIPYHFDCPVGTVWNTELTVCDWPFNVNCGTRPWFGQTAFEKHFLPNQL